MTKEPKQNKVIIGIGVAIIAILVCALIYVMVAKTDTSSDGAGYAGSTVVAKVGSEEITEKDLYEAMKELQGSNTLNQLISDSLINHEAKKEGIEPSEEDIQSEIELTAMQYGGVDALENSLKSQGQTLETLEADVANYLKVREILSKRIEVTDEEIETYFKANKDYLGHPEQVNASHILLEDEETAKEVLQKAKDGEDFTELAKKHSIEPGADESGGKLGYFSRGTMVEEFEDVAFSLKAGEISDIVETKFGYHIINLIDKQEAEEATLEGTKEQIKETIIDEKISIEYSNWFDEKQEEYKVKNYLQEEADKTKETEDKEETK